MKQRKINTGNGKKWHTPKVAVLQNAPVFSPLPAADVTFNFESNRLRDPGSPIRWGNDYWLVVRTLCATQRNYDPDLSHLAIIEFPVLEKIDPLPRPGGCDEIWHVLPSYGTQEEDPNRVWALVVRTETGSLRDIFIRAGLREISFSFPVSITQIVSQNIRPLEKIRFPTYDYFIPERDFLYMGYPYR